MTADELRRLMESTELPWEICDSDQPRNPTWYNVEIAQGSREKRLWMEGASVDTIELAIAAVNALPGLLAEADALRAELKREKALRGYTYETLREFDVYGTGGDEGACAREVKKQLQEARDEGDALRARVAEVERERDEARNRLLAAKHEVDETYIQRDEARRESDHWRDLANERAAGVLTKERDEARRGRAEAIESRDEWREEYGRVERERDSLKARVEKAEDCLDAAEEALTAVVEANDLLGGDLPGPKWAADQRARAALAALKGEG